VPDAAATLAGYLAHRARRLEEVAAALAAGAATPAEVVDVVYAGLDPALRAAAERSVTAQLQYLRTR
jgi:Beta-lactamase associated winged helix domain